MDALQAQANDLYRKYQQTVQEMIDAQRTMGVLQTISSVLGIVQSAISVGQMIGENNNAPDQTAKPEAPTSQRISVVKERTIRLGNYSETQRVEVNGDFKSLDDLQRQIHDHYRTLGIPLGVIPVPPQQIPLKWPPRD